MLNDVTYSPSHGSAGGPGHARVLIVDDKEVARQGLRLLLRRCPGLETVGEAADASTALEQVARLQPDLVLMDVNLPGMNGADVTRRIVTQFPRIRVVGISMEDPEYAGQAMRRAGACGYLSKTAPLCELVAALGAYCRPADSPREAFGLARPGG